MSTTASGMSRNEALALIQEPGPKGASRILRNEMGGKVREYMIVLGLPELPVGSDISQAWMAIAIRKDDIMVGIGNPSQMSTSSARIIRDGKVDSNNLNAYVGIRPGSTPEPLWIIQTD